MAVPFYLPEGGTDDIASSSSGASGSSNASTSSGASTTSSSGSSDGGSSSVQSQSPNTTTSATQTPMQSPLSVPTDQVLVALCEWYRLYNAHTNAPTQIFQYPPPPSPSCSCTGGDVFFPHHGGPPQPPRTPRTSVSFASGEELSFFRQPYPAAPSTPQPMPQQPPAPQSAPPLHYSHSYPQQSPHLLQHHPASYGGGMQPLQLPQGAYYATYTPPPTPNTANMGNNCNNNTSSLASSSAMTAAFGWHGHGPSLAASTPLAPNGSKMRLQRSQSDAARRKRLTSTGEDEREYQSDHETSWDEFDDRYDNFTAGRERLQEFNGRIPPRKKKNSHSHTNHRPSSPNNSNTHSHSNSNNNSNCNTHAHNQFNSSSAESNSSSSSSSITNNITNKNNCNIASSQHQQQQHRQQSHSQVQAKQKKPPQSFTWPTVVTVFVLAMGCGFFAAR
ncbi:uncharacterized protein Dwil_GK11627 [Drosophila willistoni]|uniref:Cell death protein hid n=1 Tax=Drosophila willistoni TaxID=7260 RepID=B4N467_DROWI|nr:cell death protein hid [Drosophila willistoni]EDW78941.1 uncharacterized protein Dwil_GK11627 [Drosophila willistoni]